MSSIRQENFGEGIAGGFKPALLLMSGKVAGFAATFFIPVVLARIFDPAQFGTYRQLFLIYATLYGVVQLGMAESLFYFLPMARRNPGRYATNAALVIGAGGIVCLLCLQSARGTITGWLSNDALGDPLPLLGLFLLFMAASAPLEIVMIAQGRYGWAALSYGLSDILRAVFIVLPALFLHSLSGLLLGAVGVAAGRSAALLLYLRREFPGDLRPDPALLKCQLGYALPFQMVIVLEALQANFHHYVVSHYFDAATFAIFSVGCLQLPLVDYIATPASSVMMVGMAGKIRDGEGRAALELWHNTTRKLALLFFPLTALLLVVAREFITFLFTGEYLASVPVFVLWLGTVVLAVLQTDGVLRVYADTGYLLFTYAVRLALILALVRWALFAFGLQGAVVVTLLGLAVAKGLALLRMKRLMGVGFKELLPWSGLAATLAAAAAAAVPALAIRIVLDGEPLPVLVAGGAAYTATYLALLFRARLLEDGERLTLTRWLKRPLSVILRPAGSGA